MNPIKNHLAEVLVVEDEPLLRRHLVQILSEAGFNVLEAADGSEGLQQICEAPHLAAIVTDVAMPGQLNGYGLAWKARSTHPRATVIVISGRVRAEPEELPPNAYFLSKPLAARDLLQALHASAETL